MYNYRPVDINNIIIGILLLTYSNIDRYSYNPISVKFSLASNCFFLLKACSHRILTAVVLAVDFHDREFTQLYSM